MENENKYAAELQQARNNAAAQQRENKQQQDLENASQNPDWRPDEGKEENKKYKISSVVGFSMVIVALIVDGISFLLGIFVITEPINWIVWIYAVLGFYVWLKMIGMSWNDAKGKRTLMMFGGATGIEFMPYVNMLPAWTAFVVGAIVNDRIEGILSSSPLAQKTMGMMQKRRDSGQKEEDALEKLNNKQNRTQEENIRLVKAREIMRHGSIDNNETDPALRAAFERAQRGEKAFDGSYANRDGFRFNNSNFRNTQPKDDRWDKLK